MSTHFRDYLDLLETLLDGYRESIHGLSPEALDWVPGKDMNSLAVLVAHVAGSGRFWLGDIANNDPSNRNRSAEFQVRGLTESELNRKLDDFFTYARETLTNIDPAKLSALIPLPSGDPREPVSGTWAILHALDHTALHLGHAQLTRQLWDQR
ncbi:MAG TPA: DUF664 domain-containing protein [Bellilinea sp.]|nr:DUF664 domain-containing protein [Bellilinea sp.]